MYMYESGFDTKALPSCTSIVAQLDETYVLRLHWRREVTRQVAVNEGLCLCLSSLVTTATAPQGGQT